MAQTWLIQNQAQWYGIQNVIVKKPSHKPYEFEMTWSGGLMM